MTENPPTDPAEHAEEFAHCWADKLDEYCTIRMGELGIPNDKNGEQDPNRPKSWRAFVPDERTGGYTSRGITVNSGCLNPELLKGKKGGKVWPKARLQGIGSTRVDRRTSGREDQTLDHDQAAEGGGEDGIAR